MDKGVQFWNFFLTKALDVPGVKITRNDFLTGKLGEYCTKAQVQKAISTSPLQVLSRQDIDRIAQSIIGSHLKRTTAISAISGVPGGFAIIGTIPADITQYYYHVFKLSQKLAYLYGYPDLFDQDGNVTDDTINMLTLFVGVMMGATAANSAISRIAQNMSQRAITELPKKTLTKSAIFKIVKKIAEKISKEKFTKESFGKLVGRTIPIIGGIVSGGVTYTSFRIAAKRLQKQLQNDMEFFYRGMDMDGTDLKNNSSYTDALYEDITESSEEANADYIRILVLISIAYIDNSITEKEREYINTKIEETNLTDDEKFELIQCLKDGKVPKLSFDLFSNDNNEGIHLLNDAIQLLKLDCRYTLGERLYIKRIGKELGFDSEELKEFME